MFNGIINIPIICVQIFESVNLSLRTCSDFKYSSEL